MISDSLLVTTSFSFLELDVSTGRSRCLHRGDGLYYGIAKSAEYIFVAARGRLVSSEAPLDVERGKIIVFDKKLREIDRLEAPFPLRDMHEIKWHAGALWITCSFDNMVAIFDGKEWYQWYPLGEPIGEPRDQNHFNSFLFEDEHVWLLAHNKGASTLLAYDLPTQTRVNSVNLGIQAHNIWRVGKELMTCSSAEGKIVGNCGYSLDTGGFPRGVAQIGLRRYVGISELAERKDRDFTTGVILLYGENEIPMNRIPLPGEGLVLDIVPWDGG